MVSLQGRYKWRRYRVCGGSIVSEHWILSAGHCVTDYWSKWLPLDAIVGAHGLEYIYSDQIYPISERISHPYYKGGVGPYDIAMLRTARDMQFSDKVQPIRLPYLSQNFKRDETLTITGWGALKENLKVIVIPNKLREAEVKYLPYYDCYRAVNHFKEYYEKNPLVKELNLCTGPIDESVAGCSGDSGGPLISYMVHINIYTTTMEPTTTDSTTMESTTTDPTTMKSTTTDSTTMESTTNYSTTMESTTDFTTMELTTTDFTKMESTITDLSTIDSTTMESIKTDSTTMESMTTDSTTVELTTTESTTMESTTTDSTTMESTPTDSTTMESTTTDSTTMESTTIDMTSTTDSEIGEVLPFLVGVISWGVTPCGLKGAPTVYSNVSIHIDFIEEYLYT